MVALVLAACGAVAVGPRPILLGLLWLAWVTPRFIAVDVAEHRLPDAIVLPGYPVALAALALERALRDADAGLALGSAVGYGGLLLAVHLTGGMGLGDVKLAPVLALLTTAAAPAAAVLAPLLALLVGGLASAVVLLRHGTGRSIAFGPAMLIGAWLTVPLAS